MKYLSIAGTDLYASNIVMGCMRLKSQTKAQAQTIVKTALDEGINFFDNADIYGDGLCEEIFAEAVGMSPSVREKIIVQTKCGIVRGCGYDFSRDYLVKAAEASLKRLKTEYVDLLLLHRPDQLMEPQEVAEAFAYLHSSGKVRYFGVSNHNPMQTELLQRAIPYKLVVNQLQLSVCHTPMIDSAITLNTHHSQAVNRDGSVLDYCRLKEITIQAWSPFQYGVFEGPFLGNLEKYPQLNQVIDEIAAAYGVPNTAVAIAWITRHPADMQAVIGTMNPQRMKDACQGSQLRLTRKEWYRIYQAAGNIIP